MRHALLIAALLLSRPAKGDRWIVLGDEGASSPASVTDGNYAPPAQEIRSPPPTQRTWLVEADLTADQQPTPMEGVDAGLRALAPQPGEVLVDFGCGFDARWLIDAVRRFGVQRAIGVEIDPAIAASARQYVATAGLSDRIEIITGDATKIPIQADIGVAYLPPAVLAALRPKIEQLKRFVSYDYAVPGLDMVPVAPRIHLWQQTVSVPITRQVYAGTRLLAPGSYCEICHGYCRRPMEHVWRRQVVGYQTLAANQSQAASSGHWETRRVCVNGRCRMQRVWIAE